MTGRREKREGEGDRKKKGKVGGIKGKKKTRSKVPGAGFRERPSLLCVYKMGFRITREKQESLGNREQKVRGIK